MATPREGARFNIPPISISSAIGCPRCALQDKHSPIAGQPVFCTHKYCKECLDELWNADTGRYDCDQCLNPENYPDDEWRAADNRGVVVDQCCRTPCRTPISQAVEAEASSQPGMLNLTPTTPRSVSRTPRLQLSGTQTSNINPVGDTSESQSRVSSANWSPIPDLGDKDYQLQRQTIRILDTNILREDNFGFSFLTVQAETDRIFLTDFVNHKVRVLSREGEHSDMDDFGSQGSDRGQFKKPRAIKVTENGTVIVADFKNKRIQYLTENGTFVRQITSYGPESTPFYNIRGLAYYEGRIYVTEYSNVSKIIVLFVDNGRYSHTIGHADCRQLYGLAVNASGVYANDYNWHYVFKFNLAGDLIQRIGEHYDPTVGPLVFPSNIVLDQYGFLIVCDHGNSRLVVYTPRGDYYCSIPVDQNPWDVAVQSDTTLIVSHCRQVGNGYVNIVA